MPVRELMLDDIERRLGHTVYRLATRKVETAPRLERLHVDVGGGCYMLRIHIRSRWVKSGGIAIRGGRGEHGRRIVVSRASSIGKTAEG